MADVVRLYGSDDMPAIVGNYITVAFEGEMGQDVGGVTRDFLATYWQHTLDEWFHGELIKVPCVPASRTSEAETAFLAAGRILGHGFILTRTLPPELSGAFLLSACRPYQSPSDDLLLANLIEFVSPSEAVALRNGLACERKKSSYLYIQFSPYVPGGRISLTPPRARH